MEQQSQTQTLNNYVTKEIKKVTPLIDIPQNIKYNINDIRKPKTKYGNKLFIDISYNGLGMNLEYSIYLPDRFTSLSKVNIDIFIKNPNIYFLYKGKDNNGWHQVTYIYLLYIVKRQLC
jgi:hypothetical protein